MVSENSLRSQLVDWGLEFQSDLRRKYFLTATEFFVWKLKKERSESCFHLANKAFKVHSGVGFFS